MPQDRVAQAHIFDLGSHVDACVCDGFPPTAIDPLPVRTFRLFIVWTGPLIVVIGENLVQPLVLSLLCRQILHQTLSVFFTLLH